MDERIERFLRTSREDLLKRYISPRARNRIWNEETSSEKQKSHVTEKYWNGRVKPVFKALLERLHNNRVDLLPSVSEKQIYSIGSVVRPSLEKSVSIIRFTSEDELVVSPAVALVYGIEGGEMVDISSENLYGTVRKRVRVRKFDGSVDFAIELPEKDARLIYNSYESQHSITFSSKGIEGTYKIRKIGKGKMGKGYKRGERTY